MAVLPPALRRVSPAELAQRLEVERRGVPFLVYLGEGERQTLLELDRASLSIGRQPSTGVPLTWDDEVSRVHAVLERAGDDWTLVDDGLSRNGTFVNGERVTGRRRLRDGDVISIGTTTIAFCSPSGGSTSMATVTSVGPHVAELLTPAQR